LVPEAVAVFEENRPRPLEDEMGYSAIMFSIENGIARISLNRPDARNALNAELVAELTDAIGRIAASTEVKAVVITGEGQTFCSGVDLKFLQQSLAAHGGAPSGFGDKFSHMLFALQGISVPTIAVVEGYACAGGLEMMLSCDMAIASDDALLGDRHMKQDIVGQHSMWQLPHRIGLQKAMELAVTGRLLTGKEAESYGLVLRSVPQERLEAEVEALLAQLRDKSLPALKLAKRMLQGASVIALEEEALEYIRAERNRDTGAWADMQQGIDAFADKRKTEFRQ